MKSKTYSCIKSFFYKIRKTIKTQLLNNYKIINIIIILVTFNFTSCSLVKHHSFTLRIDKELRKIFTPNIPGVAIIATKDGKIVFRKAYGLANVELNVKMEPDMLFKIGSISKQFTAVAILMLEEQGKLSLEDPVIKYFPDFRSEYENVRIKHLLSHTSGIKNYNGIAEWKKQIKESISLQELVDIFINQPFNFEPGEKFKYCNSGYLLLAQIIETITAQNYQTFIIENIIEPTGMESTIYADDESIIPNLVTGYEANNDGLKKSEYMSMTHTYGSGDIISNVDDLAKWKESLISGTIISKETLDKCFTPFILNNGTKTNYCIGWFIEKFYEKIIFIMEVEFTDLLLIVCILQKMICIS